MEKKEEEKKDAPALDQEEAPVVINDEQNRALEELKLDKILPVFLAFIARYGNLKINEPLKAFFFMIKDLNSSLTGKLFPDELQEFDHLQFQI